MSECEWCNRGLPLNDAGEHYRPQQLGVGKTLLCPVIARGRIEAQHEEIESLKTILREAEHLASAEKGNLCARIIHMKDEIERLRKQLDAVRRTNKSGCCCKSNDESDTVESACMMHIEWRDEAYERAAQTCEVEAIDLEYSEHREVDFPYNQAVKDCAMAIRALKSGEPK